MVKDPSVYKVCDRQKLDQKELVFPFDKRNRAEEGVSALAEKLSSELADAMAMCGVHSLSEITRDVVR